MVQDAARCTMNLMTSLSRTLSGTVKPMITQCSIRHLYALSASPEKEAFIAVAKSMERRRCNHHTLEQPLSTIACLSSVIDPKSTHTTKDLVNKYNYVVASQDENLRLWCRDVKGVPLIYVKRSVMIMEPMAFGSTRAREGKEREKFKSGLKQSTGSISGKRKRQADAAGTIPPSELSEAIHIDAEARKRRKRGPKEPNPLSVKRPRRREAGYQPELTENHEQRGSNESSLDNAGIMGLSAPHSDDGAPKLSNKRKRKHKSKLAVTQANESLDLSRV